MSRHAATALAVCAALGVAALFSTLPAAPGLFVPRQGAGSFPQQILIHGALGPDPRDMGGGIRQPLDLVLVLGDRNATVQYYQELHCGVDVIGRDGLFQTALGSTDPANNPLSLPFDREYWLGITVCSNPAACNGPTAPDPTLCMDPEHSRTRMSAVGYAYRALAADDADTVDGMHASQLDQSSQVTANEARIAALESQVAALQDVLQHFSRSGDDVFITNANLHVVNGTGNTQTTNGKGNLVIGYNEPRTSGNYRNGSHMLVIGRENNFSRYGGIVTGRRNSTSGNYAVTIGGQDNQATAPYSTVTAGRNNRAAGTYASVSGGRDHDSSGAYAAVTGGRGNRATGNSSSVSGGYQNQATQGYASVSGGYQNQARSGSASVSGGYRNQAQASYAWVGGGFQNVAGGSYSSASGGRENTASGRYAHVTGGYRNRAVGDYSSVTAGNTNTAGGTFSSVTGGRWNRAGGGSSSVSGGRSDTAHGSYDWVAGIYFSPD